MSAPITGRERYEWLVSGDSRGEAHAFIPGAKYAICLKPERFPMGKPAWVRQQLQPGEPQRARCRQCTRMLARKENAGMQEVEHD